MIISININLTTHLTNKANVVIKIVRERAEIKGNYSYRQSK